MVLEVAPPILVTGAPRSGTSLTTRLLTACGAWAGEVNSLWENTPIRDGILKPYLAEGGMDPLGLRWFQDTHPDPNKLRNRVESSLRQQGYHGGPWVYKDAKLVFQWKAWRDAFPGAYWVAVWRHPADIADSIRRWTFFDRYDFDPDELIEAYHSRLKDIPAIGVHPDYIIDGDYDELGALVTFLGLAWKQDRAEAIVDPSRWGTTKEAA